MHVAHREEAAAKFKPMQIEKADSYRESIIKLLANEKLPISDLPASLENFIVAMENDEVIGVAGLEVYGEYGLLRSLTVRADFRNQGVADRLLQRIDALGELKNLKEIYLLTETAPEYFKRKGYDTIARTDVPNDVQLSSEFSHVCPASAIVMKKAINTINKK